MTRIGTVVAAGLLVAACGDGQQGREGRSKPSVLLVTIDTLRADRVGGALTPTINALATQGITATAMRATAPLTLPSHATILTGMLPPEHGVRLNGQVRDPKASTTLARVFQQAGYKTAAFVGAYVLDRRFGLAEGFDEYDDRIPRNPDAPARLEAERRAPDVTAAARAWLSRFDKKAPAFVWVHFYDPHAPYEPPAEFVSLAGGKPYDGEVAFVDAQLAALLQEARRALGDQLVIAVAGDHGEGLGDHGEATHGMLAYDATLRVPFVLAGPEIAGGRRIGGATSLRDIAPTLLAAADLHAPQTMTGRNLLGNARAPETYAETTYPASAGWSPLRALADDRWKLVMSSMTELYDTVNDPAERHDVAPANRNVVQAMAARADELFSKGQSSGGHVSAEAAERLRALGYVAPTTAAAAMNLRGPNPRDRIAEWNRFESALSLLSAGRSADALPLLRELAQRDPTARVFQSTYAQALKNTGRLREALGIYRTLVVRWPDDATLFHDLAVTARDLGYTAEALKAEQAALTLEPCDPNAQNGLGLLHADEGRAADAAAAFERATELDPNNASFWTNLGNARRELGQLVEAERCYRRALTLDSREADAANGLGVVRVQQRRAREAITLFEQAIAADASLLEAQLNLGIALQESGETTRAGEQYRKVIATAPARSKEKRAASELLAALRR